MIPFRFLKLLAIAIFICMYLLNFAQVEIEIDGKVRIGQMDLDISSDSIVVRQADGTLALREANTLIEHQMLSRIGDTIFLSDGGFVVLPPDQIDDADADSTNEFQIFSVSTLGDTLFISEGNWVIIPGLTSRQPFTLNTLIGGFGGDRANSIISTTDGGFIGAGYSFSSASGDATGINNGSADYWIVKLDADGNIVWNTLIGGSNIDYAESISSTADGGSVVAGYSFSSTSGDITSTNNGSVDYWIVKLDADGNIVWNTLIGGSDGDVATSISSTINGGFVIAGYSESSASGNVTGTNNDVVDYWIVKLDAGGNIVWNTLIGGNGSEIAESISSTTDGGFVVAGRSNSSASGDVTAANNVFFDYWIVKLDADGNIVWNTLIGGNGDDYAKSISSTTDGGFVVAGYSKSSTSGDITGTNNGFFDYWIVKLDADGNIVWNTLIGGSGGEIAESIISTTDGGFVVAGYSRSSASGDVTGTNNGYNDYWIVKLDADGNIVWNTLIGGNGDDDAYSIRPTTDGGFVVAGSSGSSASGDVTGTNNNVIDYWIVKLDANGIIQN